MEQLEAKRTSAHASFNPRPSRSAQASTKKAQRGGRVLPRSELAYLSSSPIACAKHSEYSVEQTSRFGADYCLGGRVMRTAGHNMGSSRP